MHAVMRRIIATRLRDFAFMRNETETSVTRAREILSLSVLINIPSIYHELENELENDAF